MITAQIILAINGDTKAFDTLAKHGWKEPEVDTPLQNRIIFVNKVPTSKEDEDA